MNKQYTIVYLQDNVITSQDITILADVLLNNSTKLKDLWLNNNCVSDLGVQTIARTFLLNN
jgi:Ran GTPase-activating protein (RanGAP) involved in mRNA processing and transport